MSHAAQALVDRFERSVDAETRRAAGVHYTPPVVARLLVEEAFAALGRLPATICDPTCGAGSFLLAAADALLDRGIAADAVLERHLVAGEVDAGAARTARHALELWAADHGARDAPPLRVQVGESLLRPVTAWHGRPVTGFDVVVGNPPFLGQLGRRTARTAGQRAQVEDRFGLSVGYADTAALFLVAATDLVADDGVVAMVQPQSVLSARDTAAIRDRLLAGSDLVTLWGSDERHFDAAVRVCAPVLRRRAEGAPPSDTVQVRWGSTGDPVGPVPSPTPGGSWGPLLAPAHGIPAVPERGGPVLAELATATAGFRDEYYALRDAMIDDTADDAADDAAPRLLTVGMVEPGWHEWGERPRRFGGADRLRPRLDLRALESASPRVARWAAARRVPKVLVATQTRVVEAAPDPAGRCVPVTPLISVEPHREADLWAITAALLAPSISAAAVARHLGTGLSSTALRWSASAVLEVRLPSESAAWADGAALAHRLSSAAPGERRGLLERLGRVMCTAYDTSPDDPVLDWWRERALRT